MALSDRTREVRCKRDVNVPILHDSDPARLLAVAGAEPDIVLIREPDFKNAVRS
jgi:hypothetical protein